MLMTTTTTIEGRRVDEYLGIVQGEAILGANIFRDFFAGIRDIVGGRSGAYEGELRKAREIALREMQEQAAAMGANAVIGIDLDYETIQPGGSGNMLMVSASGTAVPGHGRPPSARCRTGGGGAPAGERSVRRRTWPGNLDCRRAPDGRTSGASRADEMGPHGPRRSSTIPGSGLFSAAACRGRCQHRADRPSGRPPPARGSPRRTG